MSDRVTVRLSLLLVACALAVAGQADPPASGPASPRPPFTVGKATTVLTAPLRADGTIDYVKALNERYGRGVKADENGYALWLQTLGPASLNVDDRVLAELKKALGPMAAPEGAVPWQRYEAYLQAVHHLGGEELERAAKTLADARLTGWSDADHPALAAYLERHRPRLEELRQALGRPKWWKPFVVTDGGAALNAVEPGITDTREVGYIFCARATRCAAAGDFAGFCDNVRAAKQLALHLACQTSRLDRLVGSAVDTYASETLAGVAARGGLSADQCEALLADLRSAPVLESMVESVDVSQRWILLDTVAQVATGHHDLLHAKVTFPQENGATFSQIFSAVRVHETDWDAVLKGVNAAFDEEVAALRQPRLRQMLESSWQLDRRIAAWTSRDPAIPGGFDFQAIEGETRADYSERVGRGFLVVLMPSVSIWKGEVVRRRAVQQRAMVDFVLSAAAWKAKKGQWPATLAVVARDIPADRAKDMYSQDEAGTFQYVVKPEGIRVYSLGENGKDDGGRFDLDKKLDDLGVGVP
jgi:hypothetical protein